MELGTRIRETRKNKGMSQVEVAQKAGIAVNSLRLYEGNKRQPNLSQLGKISLALGCYASDFLTPEDWSQIDMTDEDWTSKANQVKDTSSNKNNFRGSLNFRRIDEALKERIDTALSILNEKGQLVAVERIEELTRIPDYQKEEIEPPQLDEP